MSETRNVRIKGTINDLLEVEIEPGMSDEEIEDKALREWRYLEYEDLAAEVE